MGFENLMPGESIPDNINVIIEIASNSSPVKYEVDKRNGLVSVDRFLSAPMFYPCEYGFIPHTLSEDGDPLDVLVVSPYSLLPGSVIKCRPIGMLNMTDEAGKDTKILAVPIDKLTTRYQQMQSPMDLGNTFLQSVEHFFRHYKDLEPGKWAEIAGWDNQEQAKEEILRGVNRYQSEHAT